MISLPAGTQVWLAAGVTDMRRGMYGLAALVETTLAGSAYSGHVFVFRGKRGDLVKVLWADRDGLCLFAKRLERGRFVWPHRLPTSVVGPHDGVAGVDHDLGAVQPAGQRFQFLRDVARRSLGTTRAGGLQAAFAICHEVADGMARVAAIICRLTVRLGSERINRLKYKEKNAVPGIGTADACCIAQQRLTPEVAMTAFPGSAVSRWSTIVATLLLGAVLAGCEGDDGKDGVAGPAGAAGAAGTPGTAGINCWDLNANGVSDLATEDTNGDGIVDVNDCRAPSGAYDAAGLHKGYFTENAYTGTQQCLLCHGPIGDDVMETAHWKWQGDPVNVFDKKTGLQINQIVGTDGYQRDQHGKMDLINNFCQAVPGNEGRCAMCHIGYGWVDKSFDFDNPRNIDCLACHDQTGTYAKVQAPGGAPEPTVDLQSVAQSVGMNGGVPPRKACVFCHAKAGGDDNVKHGDISTRMGKAKATDPAANPVSYLDRSEDVHMGYDPVAQRGGDMKCVECHKVKKDASGNMIDHGIGGFMYHSTDEGVMKDCEDCHGSAASIHAGSSVLNIVTTHDRLACQVCHIPTFARKVATYVDWRWASAGLDARPADCAATPTGIAADGVTQRVTYIKQKGCFTWATGVRPELRYYDGRWNRIVMGINDTALDTSQPVDLGSPVATYRDAAAKIYPFKKMTGNQPFDETDKTLLVPHLWGTVTGPNPYWARFDWNLALQDGSAYSQGLSTAGYGGPQYYRGSYVFADTVMLLKVDHEVAPKEMAYGRNNGCTDCHFSNQIEWSALGWTGDPVQGGTQTLP